MRKVRKLVVMAAMVMLFTACMGMGVSAADKTLKAGKWTSGKGGAYIDIDKDGEIDGFKSSGTAYYKIKISKQGYIMVDIKTSSLPGIEEYRSYLKYELEFDEPEEESTEVRFLDAKKRELLSISNFLEDGKSIVFSAAVKKGTYYIAVSGNQKYKARYSFTGVPKVSKAGKTMNKAVILKKGITIKRLFFGEGKRSLTTFGDYYKIKLPKKTKVRMECNSKIKGMILSDLEVYIYAKKGKNFRCVDKKGRLCKNDSDIGTSFEGKGTVTYTLPKGTYYVRALSTSGSGYYTMKWK